MHEIADTEEADAAAERYWPEQYKYLIRGRVGPAFVGRLKQAGGFESLYETRYSRKDSPETFRSHNHFLKRLGDLVTVGAENGSDEMFDRIYSAFDDNQPLPALYGYARYYQPEPFDNELKTALRENIFETFIKLHAFQHIYEDFSHWRGDFNGFVEAVAERVTAGAIMGADDAVGMIYRSFMAGVALPVLRRRPRRLRG